MLRSFALLLAAACGLRAQSDSAFRSPGDALQQSLSLARSGRLQDAAALLQAARRTYPGDARFPAELAGIAYREHRVADAKRWLAEALRLSPEDPYANEFLGTLYLTDGNLTAALRYWNRIRKPLLASLRFDPPPPLVPLLRDRAFDVSGGQVLTRDRLEVTEANLRRLGLRSYRFDLTPAAEPSYDLTYHSFDGAAAPGGWLGRVLPWASGLPYQTVFLDLRDIGRRALDLTSLGRWDADKRRLAASLSGPIRLNPRYRFRVALDARDENWDLRATYFGASGGIDGLRLRKVEAGAEFTAGLTGRLEWTCGLWGADREFRNGGADRVFAGGSSFQLRNRLAWAATILPERRVHAGAEATLRTGRMLSGDSGRVVTTEGSANLTWLPQAQGDDLEVSAHASAARTFGPAPFDELFMLGMERDNDLWLRGHAGAADGRKGTAPLGSEYALLQTDVSRTVARLAWIRLQAGPFFDAGITGDPAGRFGSHGWMYDAGVQARVRAPGITVTFVYGRNLRDGGGVFYTAVTRP